MKGNLGLASLDNVTVLEFRATEEMFQKNQMVQIFFRQDSTKVVVNYRHTYLSEDTLPPFSLVPLVLRASTMYIWSFDTTKLK